jgi:hypothetical protein
MHSIHGIYLYILAWLRLEGNQLSGSAQSICHAREEEGTSLLLHFTSDCDDDDRSPPWRGGDPQEVSMTNGTEEEQMSVALDCPCCTVCCGRGGTLCL